MRDWTSSSVLAALLMRLPPKVKEPWNSPSLGARTMRATRCSCFTKYASGMKPSSHGCSFLGTGLIGAINPLGSEELFSFCSVETEPSVFKGKVVEAVGVEPTSQAK